MQVHIATAAVVRSQMEDRMNPLHRAPGNSRLAQIGANKFDVSGGNLSRDIAEMPARQVVHNPPFGAALDQLIRESRTDEGRSPCYQHGFSGPHRFSLRHSRTTS